MRALLLTHYSYIKLVGDGRRVEKVTPRKAECDVAQASSNCAPDIEYSHPGCCPSTATPDTLAVLREQSIIHDPQSG